jgi:hypothetical protein
MAKSATTHEPFAVDRTAAEIKFLETLKSRQVGKTVHHQRHLRLELLREPLLPAHALNVLTRPFPCGENKPYQGTGFLGSISFHPLSGAAQWLNPKYVKFHLDIRPIWLGSKCDP